MANNTNVVSKVLVFDSDESVLGVFRDFCNDNWLIALKIVSDNPSSVIESNVELGAVFISENFLAKEVNGVDLAITLHRMRPELPIFLRREKMNDLSGLPQVLCEAVAGVYKIDELDALKILVDNYLFSQRYPNELVRGVLELTVSAIESTFKDVIVSNEAPYVSKDKLLFGELFSLMYLESNWCRGYMMMQCEESPLSELIHKSYPESFSKDFRKINSTLSELSNLIWGQFKSHFISSGLLDKNLYQAQVPIVVNYAQRYITFGSNDPQLCFSYVVKDKNGGTPPVTILQKFVFNLNWDPEKFDENLQEFNALISAGELDLF